jgi:hypothetical protein
MTNDLATRPSRPGLVLPRRPRQTQMPTREGCDHQWILGFALAATHQSPGPRTKPKSNLLSSQRGPQPLTETARPAFHRMPMSAMAQSCQPKSGQAVDTHHARLRVDATSASATTGTAPGGAVGDRPTAVRRRAQIIRYNLARPSRAQGCHRHDRQDPFPSDQLSTFQSCAVLLWSYGAK